MCVPKGGCRFGALVRSPCDEESLKESGKRGLWILESQFTEPEIHTVKRGSLLLLLYSFYKQLNTDFETKHINF